MSIQLNITRGGGGAKQNIEKMGRLNSARQCTILDLKSLKGGAKKFIIRRLIGTIVKYFLTKNKPV